MSERSDTTLAALVRKCQGGDKLAWRQLIDLVSPLIFSICRKMRLSREESFDIFGQVCYLLLDNIAKLRAGGRVLSYVSTMTRREAYALLRKSRFMVFMDHDKLEIADKGTEQDPERLHELTRENELLMQALLSLPARERQLLRALFFDCDKPSYEETSEKLNIPVASIGPTRARSLEKLHRILKRKGYNFTY